MSRPKAYQPATWFRSTTFGDEKDRVMLKSDGVPTYTPCPISPTTVHKLERGFDVAVNVLGTDHYLTGAGRQIWACRRMGMDPAPIHVIFNQMVRAVRWNDERGELRSGQAV